jgi:hypothetical protein
MKSIHVTLVMLGLVYGIFVGGVIPIVQGDAVVIGGTLSLLMSCLLVGLQFRANRKALLQTDRHNEQIYDEIEEKMRLGYYIAAQSFIYRVK